MSNHIGDGALWRVGITFFLWDQRAPRWKRADEWVRVHVQSLFPTISSSWHLVLCLLLRKGKKQTFISSISEGSIGSRYIFTRPQYWPKTRFLGLLTPFLSKTNANSLLPFSGSTVKNLSKSVIIGQVPKKKVRKCRTVLSFLVGKAAI